MKKTTILMLMLIGWSTGIRAQCINTQLYPQSPVASNNSGDPQQIDSCVSTQVITGNAWETTWEIQAMDLTDMCCDITATRQRLTPSSIPVAYS